MKFFLPALGVLTLGFCSLAHAQDESSSANPEEVITDFGIEEYLAIPKFTLTVGGRAISGAKATFSGSGNVASFNPGSDITTVGRTRTYADGDVLANNQPYTYTYVNPDGSAGTKLANPTPAGFTNSWAMLSLSQLRDDGNIDFHSYLANTMDSGPRQENPKGGSGIDISLSRDLGHITKKLDWKLLFGVSLTDIKSRTSDTLQAAVTTTTDTYAPDTSVSGSLPTTVPYTAPNFTLVPVLGDDGLPTYDVNGSQIFRYDDKTVYLSTTPIGRTQTVTGGTVYNIWELKGAYFTFRVGPVFNYSFSDHLRASLSAGFALVYVGTTYTIEQDYVPVTGDVVVSTVRSDESRALPGYFVDATLEYDITERTGFYAGYGMQNTGSFVQTSSLNDPITGSTASYKAAVDLSSLQGFRMGLTYRF
ncbi:MAG: hypothetical protein ABI222_06525 [Opitutaceae bacterium]